jgi:hypothetical protein
VQTKHSFPREEKYHVVLFLAAKGETSWAAARRRTRRSLGQRTSFRPRLEALEDRWLLSGLPYPTATTVTQLAADISYANNTGGAFTVNLQPGTTFALTTGYLPVICGGTHSVDLTILGNGDTIDASGQFSLFGVAHGASLTLDHVTLQHGYAVYSGGAIYNDGTLTISNSIVSNNSAGTYGGGGAGGAIYNYSGTVTVSNSTLSGNTVLGWDGVDNPTGDGGAIYNVYGSVTINHSTVSGNSAEPMWGSGGGVYNGTLWDVGTLTVENYSSITGNIARYGPNADGYGVFHVDSTSTIGGKTYSGPSGGNWSSASNWSPSGVPTSSDYVLISGKSVNLAASATVRELTLADGASLAVAPNGNRVLRISALSLSANSRLDLNDNDLIVDYTGASQLGAVQALVNSARHSGDWLGAGLTSSAARDDARHNTTLGVMEASDYQSIYGAGATFDGQAIDTTAVLVKYTYYGDADFNGRVNFDDYVKTDNGFNNHLTGWVNGDFDGNGRVNFDDYVLIDLAFNTQSGTLRR